MKSTIHKCCKSLAATAFAVSLSLSLVSNTSFAQPPPVDALKQQKIERQKVDGPRKTGRTRPTDKTQLQNFGQADKRRNLANGEAKPSEATRTSTPTIRRLDPDKVKELRSRIRTERTMRIRDTQFQDERTKNIRRLVQIERVRELAEQNQNKELLERANQLRDKEIQRHTRKLAKLRHESTERQNFNRSKRGEKLNIQKTQ